MPRSALTWSWICETLPQTNCVVSLLIVLRQAADSDGALKLSALPGGAVYPEWNSVDVELEPNHVLDPTTIRAFDCVDIDSIQ